jgi:uncharacterized protein with HEPN domain
MRHEPSFLRDEVMPPAVLHHLTVIGEAISRLSVELRARYPDVPWRQIIAVRHRIVHAYFDLDWQILWDAAVEDIPGGTSAGSRHPHDGIPRIRSLIEAGLIDR